MIARDRLALGALWGYYATFKVMPSYAELAPLVGLSSKSSVFGLVERLKREGWLAATPNGRLAPTDQFIALGNGP